MSEQTDHDVYDADRVAHLPSVPPAPDDEAPRTPMAALRSLAGDMILARAYGAPEAVADLYVRLVQIIEAMDADRAPENHRIVLAAEIEQIRAKHFCAYGGHKPCDCKYSPSPVSAAIGISSVSYEMTGCPELLRAIDVLKTADWREWNAEVGAPRKRWLAKLRDEKND